MMEVLVAFIVIIAVVGGVLSASDYLKRRSSHTVMEFQRGILFRKGMPYEDVGPGVHSTLLGRDFVVYGDVRSTSMNFENQTVAMRDGSFAQYSFFASATVRDFRKAVYSARNFTEMPYYILRRAVRGTISRQGREISAAGTNALEKNIQQRASKELEEVGFSLDEFSLSHLQLSAPADANVPEIPRDLLN